MNWSDLLVIAIIGGFAFIGYKNGFIYTMFRICSFFVSAILAVKTYPWMAKILMKTSIYTNIKNTIFKNLLISQQAQTPALDNQAKQAAADAVISNLKLPGFLKDTIAKNLPNPSSLIDVTKIVDAISTEITKVVIDIIALVAIYIIIRIALIFLRTLLQGIAKLPLFKQLDKLGGISFGAIEGLLTIYIIFAVLMLFNSSPSFKSTFDAINSSAIAKFFYQNNFIISWMFPK